MTSRPVHPAADVWPMLPSDELQSLADSIAEIGLLEPIVLTPNGDKPALVLDGRNRLAACELAGVEPSFVTYDGDPVAFVLARNETRRHMTKGQRAMAAWMTISTDEVRYGQISEIANELRLTTETLRQARIICVHAPDLVVPVTVGARPLKDAYDEARSRRDAADSEQERLANLPSDLANLVREETLNLREAEAAATDRARKRADEQRDATALLVRIVDLTGSDPDSGYVDAWADRLGDDIDPELVDRLDAAIAILTELAKRVCT